MHMTTFVGTVSPGVPQKFLRGKNGKIRQFHFFEELVTLWDLIVEPTQTFPLDPHRSEEQVSY